MIATDQSILSVAEAQAFITEAEAAFEAHDVDRIVSAFHPDIVITYADFPVMHGIPEARAWLEARFSRQRNYTLRKTLRNVGGDVLGGTWEGEWEDAKTGVAMQGRGVELQQLNVEGKVVVWFASFNAWKQGETPTSPLV